MRTDKSTVNIVIFCGTVTSWLCVGGGILLFWLALSQKSIETAVMVAGAGGTLLAAGPQAVTGLFSLLAQTSTNDKTQSVKVDNAPSDPVPTAPQTEEDTDRTREIPAQDSSEAKP